MPGLSTGIPTDEVEWRFREAQRGRFGSRIAHFYRPRCVLDEERELHRTTQGQSEAPGARFHSHRISSHGLAQPSPCLCDRRSGALAGTRELGVVHVRDGPDPLVGDGKGARP